MKDFNIFGTFLTHGGKKAIILNWIFFSNDDFSEEFIIEKSQDNKEFKIIGKITKIIHSRRIFFYLFNDENIEYGNISYRIFLRKKRGPRRLKKIISKSNIATINLTDNNPNINNVIKLLQLHEIEAE